MGKKSGLEDILGVFSRGRGKNPAEAKGTTPSTLGASKPAERAPAEPPQEKGILDPILTSLDYDRKFDFLSGLMDTISTFLVRTIDTYSLQLSTVENAIATLQSTVVTGVRSIRGEFDKARQEGYFKPREAVSRVPGMPFVPIARPATIQPGEKDIMDIAASIRTLISKQKELREATVTPDVAVPAGKPSGTVPPAREGDAEPELAIDSKLERYKKSTEAQKTHMDAMAKKQPKATAGEPAAAEGTTATRPRPRGRKRRAKATAPKPVEEPIEEVIPEEAPAVQEPPRTEKDFLPEGFQDELMKNIKDLIKTKDGKK
jgi:hypothetical protein